MLVGLAVTTVTLHFAIQEGGEYFIFYGPVVVGAWGLARGLWKYITKDRKTLKELKKKHKKKLMSEMMSNLER